MSSTDSLAIDQPKPVTIRSSWVAFSCRVAMIPVCPAAAPLKMKCSPMSVFPDPDGPATIVDEPGQ